MSNTSRKAYETLEPFHILAYFNPGIGAAQEDTGLDGHAFYVGARGGPLGPCHSSVVVSAFYNFSPALIDAAWTRACAADLDALAARRDAMLDEQFHTILGDVATAPVIAELADRYGELAASAPMKGRPLAAGWAGAPVPEKPILRLWHNIGILREWRGDNHIAALVVHGLDGLDAYTFHESHLLDPTIRRRTMGKRIGQVTRGWSDQEWDASVARLVERGLVEADEPDRSGVAHRYTEEGARLYGSIETMTDQLGDVVWSAPGTGALLDATRPLVKTVIDAEVLPGTKKRK
ncbi:hypothetical protein HUN08_17235 [Gordonia sp. X0973]|uniref:SCO6745 family protein n=1 Tax=Gordonia sp. X0973 TaxID=2742602 RepID=UPI000F54B0EA|nr:hypothetical protein [Gordonia sp. X0973]QKT08750.1 hypothetical protein HUN08_17235 [Gordonia sp. X0973]